MDIFNYIRTMINGIKYKKHFLLDSPKDLYSDLIANPKISNMIDNMPKNLSQIEKAYYLYSNKERKYIKKSKDELKEFLNQFDKNSLRLTNPSFFQAKDNLELE